MLRLGAMHKNELLRDAEQLRQLLYFSCGETLLGNFQDCEAGLLTYSEHLDIFICCR